MSDESPKPSPEVIIKQGATTEDMAQSIRVIEGLFHAINAASFPLRSYEDVMRGMQFLKAVHDSVIKELGPDEVARIRAAENFKQQAPAAPVAGTH